MVPQLGGIVRNCLASSISLLPFSLCHRICSSLAIGGLRRRGRHQHSIRSTFRCSRGSVRVYTLRDLFQSQPSTRCWSRNEEICVRLATACLLVTLTLGILATLLAIEAPQSAPYAVQTRQIQAPQHPWPGAQRATLQGERHLYFVPMGLFPSDLMERLVAYYREQCGPWIEPLSAVPIPRETFDPSRRQPIGEAGV